MTGRHEPSEGLPRLWVVIPTYNEERAIADVIHEWLPVLRNARAELTICAVDDGSTDGTGAILDELAIEIPELRVVHQGNIGHGATCLRAYRQALLGGADWVLQIDSDGQCDPVYFSQFWQMRGRSPAVYGYRFRRDDGWLRWLASRVVSGVVIATTGAWVRDANVPYRLMRRDVLEGVLDFVSEDTCLPNIGVAALQAPHIRWIPIRFLQRTWGDSKTSAPKMARRAVDLARGLREVRARSGPLPLR